MVLPEWEFRNDLVIDFDSKGVVEHIWEEEPEHSIHPAFELVGRQMSPPIEKFEQGGDIDVSSLRRP